MKAWQATPPFGIDALRLVDVPQPTAGPRQVVVRVHAAALNYRDLEMACGSYQGQPQTAFTLLSDGAGEVVEVGSAVTGFALGDRVIGCFWQGWEAGCLGDNPSALPLGGPLDGMLSEYVVLDERGVVHCPAHLSWEEAATLPCAALTAWQALVSDGQVKAGDWVLLQGTGGVSMFALQFALLHGARVIITSSQDDKLQRAGALGATGLINYRRTPDWPAEVMVITEGYGVDHVLEVGGPRSFTQSLQALHPSGQVNVIGYLGGQQGDTNPLLILQRNARIRGIAVGPRQSFEAMNRAITASQMRPLIDSVQDWLSLPAALTHLQAAGHVGKVVLRITPPLKDLAPNLALSIPLHPERLMQQHPMAMRQVRTEPNPFEPFALSQAIAVGNWLFVSGQAAISPHGVVVAPGDFQQQAEYAFANLEQVLTAGGSCLADVVKVTLFLTDMRYLPEVVALRRRFFCPPYPADSIVEVRALALPELMFEIEAIAVLGAGVGKVRE